MHSSRSRRLSRSLCFSLAAVAAQAQTATTLLTFDATNGKTPVSFIQGSDGNFYGIAQSGGSQGNGEVFQITPAGTFSVLISFKSPTVPTSLMQAKDGNFYGTTMSDGINHKGTIFQLTPAGTLTTLYQFSTGDGANPIGGLVQGKDGNFYGTTSAGGPNVFGYGTIFQLTPSGTLTTLYSFSGTDGAFPAASLIQATDGNFYGTTLYGGNDACVGEFGLAPNGCGTVFKITPSGTLTTLYIFRASSDSGYPAVPLVQGPDGNLYGTTSVGAGSVSYNGTFFKITPSGTMTVLHDFTKDNPLLLAPSPQSNLVLSPDGTFLLGLSAPIVRLTLSGAATTVYTLCQLTNCADGVDPVALVLAADGNLYGAARGGGIGGGNLFSGDGVLFKVSLASVPAGPSITLVANAEGEAPVIAANTWVEIKGSLLAPSGVSSPDCAPGYCWQNKDFVNNQMPTSLNGVSVTVNGKNAFIYYISPAQINILTPPDTLSGPVQVQVINNGAASAPISVQTQSISPSFFVFDGTHVAAVHLNGTLIGPTTLYPGHSFPAKPNETIVLFANGFGPTSTAVISGSITQSGTLSPLPAIKIGGFGANVGFAGLVSPGEYQFNVTIPNDVPDGDQTITATYNGSSTQAAAVITIQH